jgi:uridine phosphorylase
MRRLRTFDTGPVMYHLGISHAHPNIISGGSPGRVLQIAKYFDSVDGDNLLVAGIRRIANHFDLNGLRKAANYFSPGCVESERGLVTVHGKYKGVPITAFSTGMGPASVSITLPEVIEACDEDDMLVLRLGTTGGLQKELNIGDFVATTWVQRAENTSDKIMGEGYHAESDADVRKVLLAAAERNRHGYQQVFEGPTRVTNDIYFDQGTAHEAAHGSEVLAVSMEFSVYCALRDWYNQNDGRKIKAGNLLTVSDSVVAEAEPNDMTEFKRRQTEIEDAHIKAGLDAIVMLRNK